MRDRILPEFQDFLLSRSLVPAKNAPFYAHWVSQFLTFSNKNQNVKPNIRIEKSLIHVLRVMVRGPINLLDDLYDKKPL